EPVARVPQGRAPALAAGRVRREPARVHPGRRRLRELGAPRVPADAHDRQRRPRELPRDARLPVGGRDLVRADGDHHRAGRDLLEDPRDRGDHLMAVLDAPRTTTAPHANAEAGGRYAPRWLRRAGNGALNGWALLAYVYLFAPIIVIIAFSFNNLNGITHPF